MTNKIKSELRKIDVMPKIDGKAHIGNHKFNMPSLPLKEVNVMPIEGDSEQELKKIDVMPKIGGKAHQDSYKFNMPKITSKRQPGQIDVMPVEPRNSNEEQNLNMPSVKRKNHEQEDLSGKLKAFSDKLSSKTSKVKI